MAALRCLSKGALKQNLTGLRQSTSIYVMIAALIVLTSVLIAGILLPRLGSQIEAMHKPTGESLPISLPLGSAALRLSAHSAGSRHYMSVCPRCRVLLLSAGFCFVTQRQSCARSPACASK